MLTNDVKLIFLFWGGIMLPRTNNVPQLTVLRQKWVKTQMSSQQPVLGKKLPEFKKEKEKKNGDKKEGVGGGTVDNTWGKLAAFRTSACKAPVVEKKKKRRKKKEEEEE